MFPSARPHSIDHIGSFPVFYASDDTETMDDIWSGLEEISGEYYWDQSSRVTAEPNVSTVE